MRFSVVIVFLITKGVAGQDTSATGFARDLMTWKNSVPIRDFYDLAGYHAGVVKNLSTRRLNGLNQHIHIRGSRPHETGVLIDGFPQSNVHSGLNRSRIPMVALDRLSIATSSFDPAEAYAGGVIEVNTKSGGERLSGEFNIEGDPVGLGMADAYGHRVLSGSLGGPVPGFESSTRFFISGEIFRIQDADPSIWGHPEFRLTANGSRSTSPSVMDTVEFIRNSDGALKYKKGPRPKQFSNVGVNSDQYFALFGKVNVDLPGSRIRMHVSGNWSRDWRRDYEAPRAFSNNDNNKHKSSNGFLGISASYAWSRQTNFHFSGLYTVDSYEMSNDRFGRNLEMYNGHTLGQTRYSTYHDDNLLYDIGRGSLAFTFEEDQSIRMSGQLVHYATKAQTIRIGVDFERHNVRTLRMRDIGQPAGGANTINGFRIRTNAIGEFEIERIEQTSDFALGVLHPTRISCFAEHFAKFDNVSIGAAVRYDRFNAAIPSGKNGLASSVSTLDLPGFDVIKNRISPSVRMVIDPSSTYSISISFRRHFQIPIYRNLLSTPAERYMMLHHPPFVAILGNPGLDPVRTDAYEARLIRNSGSFTIDAAIYHKDVKGLVNTAILEEYSSVTPTFANVDRSTIHGVEINGNWQISTNFSSRFAYTFQMANGTGSSETSGFRSAWLGYADDNFSAPLSFDQRHTLGAMAEFRTNAADGPKIGRMFPAENASVGLAFSAGSGFPYTPTVPASYRLLPGRTLDNVTARRNSRNTPWTYRLDLRASKNFFLMKSVVITTYLDVLNAFDRKNVTRVYSGSGRPDSAGYESATNERREMQYDILNHDGLNWDTPRQARLGVIFNF